MPPRKLGSGVGGTQVVRRKVVLIWGYGGAQSWWTEGLWWRKLSEGSRGGKDASNLTSSGSVNFSKPSLLFSKIHQLAVDKSKSKRSWFFTVSQLVGDSVQQDRAHRTGLWSSHVASQVQAGRQPHFQRQVLWLLISLSSTVIRSSKGGTQSKTDDKDRRGKIDWNPSMDPTKDLLSLFIFWAQLLGTSLQLRPQCSIHHGALSHL